MTPQQAPPLSAPWRPEWSERMEEWLAYYSWALNETREQGAEHHLRLVTALMEFRRRIDELVGHLDQGRATANVRYVRCGKKACGTCSDPSAKGHGPYRRVWVPRAGEAGGRWRTLPPPRAPAAPRPPTAEEEAERALVETELEALRAMADDLRRRSGEEARPRAIDEIRRSVVP